MTIQEQISQLGQQQQQSLDKTFSGISEDVGKYLELEKKKAQTVADKLDYIEEISKEIGMISGEYVREEKERLIKEIKSNILKDRKVFGSSFGKTLDLSKLASFDKDIRKLGNLSETSRVVDQFWKMGQEKIQNSALLTDKDKQIAMNQMTRAIVDKDNLENFSFAQLSERLDNVVKSNTDDLLVLENVIGDIGTRKVAGRDEDGNEWSYEMPQKIMRINTSNGQLEYTEEGRRTIENTVKQLNQQGYNIDEATIYERYRQKFNSNSAYKSANRLDTEYKLTQIAKAKKEMNESDEENFDMLVEIIQDPRSANSGGYGKTSERALRQYGRVIGADVSYMSPSDVRGISGGNARETLEAGDQVTKPDTINPNATYLAIKKGNKLEIIDLSDPTSSDAILSHLIGQKGSTANKRLANYDWLSVYDQDAENDPKYGFSFETMQPEPEPKEEEDWKDTARRMLGADTDGDRSLYPDQEQKGGSQKEGEQKKGEQKKGALD